MKRYFQSTAGRFMLALVALALAISYAPLLAQEHTPDQHTLLLLHFNDDLNGAQGETPTQMSGVNFEPGIFGNGAYFAPGNQVYFPSAGNLNSTEGTLEFWIKPRWNGNDGQNHVVLRYGVGGGMLFFKDGANNWRSIFNRFGSEVDVALNVNAWQANQWHHAAFTWKSDSLKLYVDGQLQRVTRVTVPLNVFSESAFQLGADFNNNHLHAALDELRLSAIERSPDEIRASYLAGISILSLALQPDPITLLETWRTTPALVASTNFGTMNIPPTAAQWSSSNPAIASVAASGRTTAIAAGQATITATFRGVSGAASVIVNAPVLPPLVEHIDPYLATPAAKHLWEMPVVIIRYFPTRDGVNVDPIVSDWNSTLASLRAKIDRDAIHTKFMLEEGSRFRGYKDPKAPPALGYRVIHIVTVYEEMPPGFPTGTPGIFFPDYDQIITRFGAENFVENLGVKEFWIWGYHHGNIVPVESNMSSPTTGDISNSFRFNNDLPVFNRTYTLYNYNFTRGPNEDVHNHGHQLEAILSHANRLQDGNTELFWKKFVGQNANGTFITGRCGWTHMPPNTTQHYDYNNTTLVASDIEDWTPDRIGAERQVNAATWGGLTYAWPYNDPPGGLTEAQWYIYWMQNMPGLGNQIRHGQNYMTNWWEFTGDWDQSIGRGLGLYAPVPSCLADGDLNDDQQLTPGDALCAFQIYLHGGVVPSACDLASSLCELAAADVNCDGTTTPGDALAIFQRYLQAQPPEACFAQSPHTAHKSRPAFYQLSLQHRIMSSSDRERVRVSLRVAPLAALEAFGLTLSYPADKLEFMGVRRTALTAHWEQLAAHENAPGAITIAGFTLKPSDQTEAGEALEIIFAAKGPPVHENDFHISNLDDDFREAQIEYLRVRSEAPVALPKTFQLEHNFPNPFSAQDHRIAGTSETEIRFALPQASPVTVKIFNLLGEEIRALVDEPREAGYHAVRWNGRDKNGNAVASGIYLYQLRAGNFSQVRKMSLQR